MYFIYSSEDSFREYRASYVAIGVSFKVFGFFGDGMRLDVHENKAAFIILWIHQSPHILLKFQLKFCFRK